ncbi:GH3 auxin-responsive promoter family protein [Candidatus Magnetomorum sp. HK-1]|nr:GH3 auxin-responsive promoter family protein [Candidatus Magnetomorum sp. HK-1]
MNMLTTLCHHLAYIFNYKGYLNFVYSLKNIKETQGRKLKQLLHMSEGTQFFKDHPYMANMDYEDFAKKFPLTNYENWAEKINRQKENQISEISKICDRYQPTSGSTSHVKWIPYTEALLFEFDQAISPWIYDIVQTEKKVLKGKHYWSLSWLPTHLRDQVNINANDDLALLPLWKRIFMSQTMAIPQKLSLAPSSESAILGTIAYLVSHADLSLISVWSPTFALNMLNEMALKKDTLSLILSKGKWNNDELSFLPCPMSKKQSDILKSWDGKLEEIFFRELWPDMKFISAWDTSTSKIWAQELQKLFPSATFQGKGLWATECVVTIPFQNKYPLAVNSHFYEFADIESNKVYPSWNLEKGMIVKPVVSTGSGLYRYVMKDRLEVYDFLFKTPCLRFLGRIGDVDMVGEKMSPEMAINILSQVNQKFNVKTLTLMAVTNQGKKPYYYLLCEGRKDNNLSVKLAKYSEEILSKAFHYKLARELNQLGKARSIITPNARQIYQDLAVKKGMILGNLKIEPLTLCEDLPFDNNDQ